MKYSCYSYSYSYSYSMDIFEDFQFTKRGK